MMDQLKKRQLDADLTSDSCQTVPKKMSMDLPPNFKQWTVEETCQYLQLEGLGKWENIFEEHKITGDKLQGLMVDDLEKMGIEKCYCEKIWDILRKLWQIPSKVFNDPIHGHVELHPLLVKIMDTPQFQRLRNLKQLGGVYFVYPGASHNRFEHCIGVGYLAGELARALQTRQPELHITDRDILCVQIAGLCHDLGHGPFSHQFETFVNEARPQRKWKHEDASLQLFDHLVKSNSLEPVMERYGLKPNEDLTFIKEMIKPPKEAAGQTWPYKGRQEDKSFLYEIVANKRNGIDVDKFDYLARDSYHLAIQNSFDYCRFLKFARVCEVAGQKHICTRDKEEDNMYEIFHIRMSLHRRAYQHKVNHIIQHMITEAFLKADKHIKIEGSGGKKFTLSEAVDDMEAYTKLTDCVFEEILNSSSPKLKDAREILQRLVFRDLYAFLGEVQREKPDKEMICKWKDELANALPQGEAGDVVLEPEDFGVLVITLDYGMKDKNPINYLYFYSKYDITEAFTISNDKVSKLRPQCFSDQQIMVYCKKTDGKSMETARKHFDHWSNLL